MEKGHLERFLWLLKATKTKDNILRREIIRLIQRFIPNMSNSHDPVKAGPKACGLGKER